MDKIAYELNIISGGQLIRIWDKNDKLCYSYNRSKLCNEIDKVSQKSKKEFISKELKNKEKK
ncbi:hypothetical protein [Spiroplasma tabanidicola]|uniref:hypothetical protein n=1 Tax=Spiroplasma tabanidicola TaxID=324079 RepID=UPI0012DC3EF7|nr:hypothetical protein [Spiroplasma tabanidicola]